MLITDDTAVTNKQRIKIKTTGMADKAAPKLFSCLIKSLYVLVIDNSNINPSIAIIVKIPPMITNVNPFFFTSFFISHFLLLSFNFYNKSAKTHKYFSVV